MSVTNFKTEQLDVLWNYIEELDRQIGLLPETMWDIKKAIIKRKEMIKEGNVK